LLNHTSGIVDYHYLGDPIEATSRQPKALDEVTALYAGKNWVNDPAKWDWSISGFNLLVTIVERVIGQSFPDYVQQNIFKPAGVKSTSYCDDFTLTRGLAHAYRKIGAGYIEARENAWPITLICASAPPWAIYFSCGAPSKTKILFGPQPSSR